MTPLLHRLLDTLRGSALLPPPWLGHCPARHPVPPRRRCCLGRGHFGRHAVASGYGFDLLWFDTPREGTP